MTLAPEDLNETDKRILAVLDDGRATPTLVRKQLAERGEELSRQYVSQRIRRLTEHGHLQNVLGTGVYELVDDPREANE